MSKGNKLPEVSMKKTKIAEFDDLFTEAETPLGDVVGLNNGLDEQLQGFRQIGRELRTESDPDKAPPSEGDVKLAVQDSKPTFTVEKDGAAVAKKSLTKGIQGYYGMCEKKCTKVFKRLQALHKVENCGEATLKPADEGVAFELVLGEAQSTELKDKPVLVDFHRSLGKLNDRLALLEENLKGPITLGETITGVFNNAKKSITEAGKNFKEMLEVKLEDGVPAIAFKEDLSEIFSPLLSKAWELLQKLLELLKKIISDLPAIGEKIQGLLETAKEFPGKMKEAAAGAGISGPKEMMAVASAIKADVNQLKGAPGMMKTLTSTVQDTGMQISTAANQATAA